MRPWIYQTCNEIGWYQTSTSRKQPFGTNYPLDFFTTLCADAYGKKFTPEYIQKRLDNTNKIFGGLRPEVENVYMTHGQLDPWRSVGLEDENQVTIIPSKFSPLLNISSTNYLKLISFSVHAHCKDLGSISDRDTPELRASKEKVAALVRQWLAD